QDHLAAWGLSAIAAPENMPKVVATIQEEIQHILSKGFSVEEVGKAKDVWQQGRLLRRSNNDVLVANLIILSTAGRQLPSLAELDRAVASLTAEEVNAAFRKYFRLENLSLVTAVSPQAVK
ncbi:MAG: hypothetical protein RLZZ502_1665, partial [Pseudomonadota bacterium]